MEYTRIIGQKWETYVTTTNNNPNTQYPCSLYCQMQSNNTTRSILEIYDFIAYNVYLFMQTNAQIKNFTYICAKNNKNTHLPFNI